MGLSSVVMPPFLVAAMCLSLTACKNDIEFTEAPFPASDKSENKPVLTTIFSGIPIDLTEMQIEAERAIPRRITRIRSTLRRAACYERKGRRRCRSAYVEGSVARDGAIRIGPGEGGLQAVIPVKLVAQAKGRGPARAVEDTVSEKFEIHAAFNVDLDENWRAKVGIGDISFKGNPSSVKLLGRDIRYSPALKRKLTRLTRYLPRRLEKLLNEQNFQETAATGWRRLFDPIKISSTTNIWLRGRPIAVSFGGFEQDGQQVYARIAYRTSLGTYVDERPVPLMPVRLPSLSEKPEGQASSHINLTLRVKYDQFESMIDKAFDNNKLSIGTDQSEVEVSAEDPEIYASRRFLALKLKVNAHVGDDWFDKSGSLYLTALPSFDPEKGVLTLSHVAFTEPRPNPQFFRDGNFLFQKSPYAKWFKNAVHLDLNGRFERLLAGANTMVNRKIGKTFWLRGRLKEIGVTSISPREDHLLLNLKLRGTLSLTLTPPKKLAAQHKLSIAATKSTE